MPNGQASKPKSKHVFPELGLRAWIDRHQNWIALSPVEDGELEDIRGWYVKDPECPAFVRKVLAA